MKQPPSTGAVLHIGAELLGRLHRVFAGNRCLRIASFVAPVLIFVLLAWRQHRFVDHYAVNMMFWDQWDFYLPIFNDEGLWNIFARQHGPHRQGAGFLVTYVLAGLGGWNSRWDAFGISFTLILASLAGFALAIRCGCRARLALPVVALLFFNLRQYEVFAGASNLSHGAFPVLLLMLYGLSLFVASPVTRLALVSGLTFLLIFTGFGIFAGLLTPVLLLVEAVQSFRSRDNRRGSLTLAALGLSAISWMIFARGYVFAPAVENFHFPHERPVEYFYFVGMMLSNFCGIPDPKLVAITLGLVLTAALAILCAHHGWRFSRNDGRKADVAIFVLSAFVLLYCFNTAVGRVCLGYIGAAQSSRYVTLIIPAGLAAYIALNLLLPRYNVAVSVLFIGLLAAGTLNLNPSDWANIRWFHDGRLAWKTAYLETRDESLANQRSGFKVYPAPGKITERLHYLEQHRLNLFNEEKAP